MKKYIGCEISETHEEERGLVEKKKKTKRKKKKKKTEKLGGKTTFHPMVR